MCIRIHIIYGLNRESSVYILSFKKKLFTMEIGGNPRFFCSGSVQPSGVRGRTTERYGKLRLAGSRVEPTTADGKRVLL